MHVAAAKLAGPLFDGSGYYTEGRAYTNQTAQHAIEQLKKTAIFYVFGHGGALFQSCQTFWDGNQWSYMVETEYARQRIINSGVPAERVVALATLPDGALNKVLLAVFEGCYTAYYNDLWGSPAHGAVAKGADCSLGFTTQIRDPDAHSWAEHFWTRITGTNDTVQQAAGYASSFCSMASGLRDWKIIGASSTGIAPARYGN